VTQSTIFNLKAARDRQTFADTPAARRLKAAVGPCALSIQFAVIVSIRQSDEATSPPSKLDKSNDNDADQGIVVDANGEEDAEPAKTARVERSAADEDQGIVADKEDTPSNSVEFHPTDAERRQESDVTINGDANPEIAENNAPPSTTTADVAKTDVSSGDTAAADVVRDNMEVSSDQTHASDFDNTQKKSSDSGVEIKEAHDDLDEVTAVVNKSADEDNATGSAFFCSNMMAAFNVTATGSGVLTSFSRTADLNKNLPDRYTDLK